MADGLMPDEGPLLSFLDWLDRPGQVVRNLITGRPEAAGRQALDFFGEIPDAFLPGNLIPDATSKDDYVAPHELVGMDEDTPWYARVPTDIGLGILTDPLSLVGIGEVAGAARAGLKVGVPFVKSLQKTIDVGADIDPFRALERGYSSVPVVPDKLAPFWQGVRSTFGAERLSPEVERLRDQALAAGMNVNRAGSDAVADVLSGATAEDRANMVRVLGNVRENPNGGWSELLAGSDPRNPLYDIAKKSDDLAPLDVGPFSPAKDAQYERIKPVPQSDLLLLEDMGQDLDKTGLHYLQKAIPEMADPEIPSLHQMLGVTAENMPEAFPSTLNESRYASGIDLTNDVLSAGPDRIRTSAGNAVREVADEAPQGGDIARSAKAVSRGAGPYEEAVASARDPLTGAPIAKPAMAPRVELPESVNDRLNEMMGGPKSETVSQSVTSAPPITDTFDMLDNQIRRLNERVDALGLPELDAERLKGLLAKRLTMVHNQYKELIQDYPAFYRPIGRDIEREMPADYAHGRYELPEDNETIRDAMVAGNPSALKEKTLRTGMDRADFFNSTGAKPVLDIAEVDANRMAQQSHIVQKAVIGKGLIEQWAERARLKKAAGESLSEAEQAALDAKGKTLAPKEGEAGASFNAATQAILKEMGKTGQGAEDAQVLSDIYNGLPPRGGFMTALAKANRYFKPYVVFGAVLPKVGSLFRNRTSGIAQIAAEPGADGAVAAMANPINIASDLTSAAMEGLGLGEHAPGQAFRDTKAIGDAYKRSGGRAALAEKALREAGRTDLAEAVKHGVLDSFTGAEGLLTDIKNTGWRKFIDRVVSIPAVMFQAIEHQMRLRTFQRLLEDGKAPEEAARITGNALYRYNTSSLKNRNLRDFIPFAQWSAKAIPQQAKWIGRNPAVGVGLGGLYGQDNDETIYPYLAEKSGFSLGHNPDGTLGFASGFGLPSDSLSMIPGPDGIRSTGREFERNVIAGAHPLLKTAYSAASGRDPYFGTASFSYDHVPLLGAQGGAGRLYQFLTGAGLNPMHPALAELDALGKGLTGEHSAAVTALDLLTGTNVVDVDQDRALQQILQNELSTNPDIQHYDTLYSQSQDPDTLSLLDDYRQLQAKIKKKRKAD